MSEQDSLTTFNICVAVEENYGFGNGGGLPWPHLKTDYDYYLWLTGRRIDPTKKLLNIKGRLTYDDSVVSTELSRPGVLTVVVSNTLKECPSHAYKVVSSIEAAMSLVDKPPLAGQIEEVWVMGGQRIFEEAIKSKRCHRIYFTQIFKAFKSDRFFPRFKHLPDYMEVKDPAIDGSMQETDGVKFQFQVYERVES